MRDDDHTKFAARITQERPRAAAKVLSRDDYIQDIQRGHRALELDAVGIAQEHQRLALAFAFAVIGGR